MDLTLRDGVTEIVAHRDAAVKLWAEALEKIRAAAEAIAAAEREVTAACGGARPTTYGQTQCDEVQAFHNAVQLPDPDQYLRVANRLTDALVWASIIERTSMDHLMDKKLKDELRQQMAYVPEQIDRHTGQVINAEEIARSVPPVTVECIEETLDSLVEDSPNIFRRGLANAFARLDRRFRSHDGFKIGARVIVSHCFSSSWGPTLDWNYSGATRDTLLDIERALLVLDGKGPRAAYAGIVGAVDAFRARAREARETIEWPVLIQADYFRLRAFKNGNAHLWFERDDLVEKANRELAKWYGAAVADGKDRPEDEDAPLRETAVGHARNLGYFPTPKDLAWRVIEEASLYRADGSPRLRVLEPSAGDGALARLAVECGASVRAIELDHARAQALARELPQATVTAADFLELPPRPEYDRVVMNPPFDRGRDVDHVWRAWQWLKPGGRLVAIMSAGTEYRQDKKAAAFRAAMEKAGARWRDLPAGSFAPATNVNTMLLTVWKPEES